MTEKVKEIIRKILSGSEVQIKIDGVEISNEINCGAINNIVYVEAMFSLDEYDKWKDEVKNIFNVTIVNTTKDCDDDSSELEIELFKTQEMQLTHVSMEAKKNDVVLMKLIFKKTK